MHARIHFDANAGLPLHREVRAAMVAAFDVAANPSSVHAEGRAARAIVERARVEVAGAVGARPENVVFTSGATEAAALALSPRFTAGARKVSIGRAYIGATEHPAVLSGGRFRAGDYTLLPVGRSGVVDLEALESALSRHDREAGPPLVALMLANNETGVIHPVTDAVRLAKRHGGYVFCDAVQALGRIPLDIGELGIDAISLSAHKIGGPQGVGALILADADLRPDPLLKGGGQERRLRAGTENVAAIAGFGVAALLTAHHLLRADEVAGLRRRLEAKVLAVSPEAIIAGSEAERLSNTTMFLVPGLSAETMVVAFDLEGIAVSAGAACSSGKIAASHVLSAMRYPEEMARAGIRVSLPGEATIAEVDAFALAWQAIHARLGRVRAA